MRKPKKKAEMSEPDFEGFDGIYVGSANDDFIMPPNEIDFPGLSKYMRETGKCFQQLTDEEIGRFKF